MTVFKSFNQPKLTIITLGLFLSCMILPLNVSGQDEENINNIRALSWSPDTTLLAVGGVISNEAGLWLYNSMGDALSRLGDSSNVLSLAWSPDGKKLASLIGDSPDHVDIWDVETGNILTTFDQEGGTSDYAVRWSSDGSRIATARGSVYVWDVSTGEMRTNLRMGSPTIDDIQAFSWHPTENQIVTANVDQFVRVWDVATASIIRQSLSEQFVVSLSYHPDGTRLALGDANGTIQIWDAETDAILASLDYSQSTGPERVVWLLDWSLDGNELAGAGSQGPLTVWNVSTGQTVDTIERNGSGFIEDMDYSAYGGRLAYAISGIDLFITPISDDMIAQSLANGALQIVVPAPSVERLQSIAERCDAPPSIEQTLTEGIEFQALTAEIQAISSDQLPPGCAADLLAVAEALQSQ